jgi:tRNA (mo5U34)-methyltransferase
MTRRLDPVRMRPPRDLRRAIEELGPWFHNLVLDGIETAPSHFLGDHPRLKWESFRSLVPDDLTGATVLDVGCNGGFFALEMKRRGAKEVVALDPDPRYLAQAALAAEVTGLDLTLRRMSVYAVAQLKRRFDLVLFMGVLYHLRHPLLALDLLHEHAVGDLLLFQSLLRGHDEIAPLEADYPFTDDAPFRAAGAPLLHFVEHRYAGDPTNWWVPNRAAAEAMLRSAGFAVTAQAGDDVYLCTRSARPWHVEAPPAVALRVP